MTLFDNSRRLARIQGRYLAYSRITGRMLRSGIPLLDILRMQFPFTVPVARRPPTLTLELTNVCDLRCTYCNYSLIDRPRGFMNAMTMTRIVDEIDRGGIQRVKLTGLGEATLHPNFPSFLRRLALAARFVSIVSNAQWRRPEILAAILEAPLSMLEISIDAGGRTAYESSRPGASYDRLLENLRAVKRNRRKGCSPLVIIRLMMRPSQAGKELELGAPYREFADAIMPQYILKRKGAPDAVDVYIPTPQDQCVFPRCTLPFKDLNVRMDGSVQICMLADPDNNGSGTLLGNVNTDSLIDMWRSPELARYRRIHRIREGLETTFCRGCPGA